MITAADLPLKEVTDFRQRLIKRWPVSIRSMIKNKSTSDCRFINSLIETIINRIIKSPS